MLSFHLHIPTFLILTSYFVCYGVLKNLISPISNINQREEEEEEKEREEAKFFFLA